MLPRKSAAEFLAVLELPVGATREEVRTAYRELCMIWHPDRHPEGLKSRANEKLKALNEAYDWLKSHYKPDEPGKPGMAQPPRPGPRPSPYYRPQSPPPPTSRPRGAPRPQAAPESRSARRTRPGLFKPLAVAAAIIAAITGIAELTVPKQPLPTKTPERSSVESERTPNGLPERKVATQTAAPEVEPPETVHRMPGRKPVPGGKIAKDRREEAEQSLPEEELERLHVAFSTPGPYARGSCSNRTKWRITKVTISILKYHFPNAPWRMESRAPRPLKREFALTIEAGWIPPDSAGSITAPIGAFLDIGAINGFKVKSRVTVVSARGYPPE